MSNTGIQKLGIDRIKFAVIFVIVYFESLMDKLEDKKLTWGERLSLITELKPLLEVIKNWREMKLQVLDLDSDEEKEIIELVQLELDLPNEVAKKRVINALKLLAALFEFINTF